MNSNHFLTIALNIVITGCIYLIDLAVPLGVAGGVPYVLSIIVSFWIPKQKSTIITGVFVSILVVTGYIYSPPGEELQWIVLTNRFLALFAIWTTVFFVLKLKTTINKLNQSRWRLKSAEKVAHVGHFEIDPVSGNQQWSDEMFRITGFDPEEGAPSLNNFAKKICKGDKEKFLSEFRDKVKDDQLFDMVYCIRQEDGEKRYLHSIGRVGKKQEDSDKRMYGTLQDITEKAKAEEKVRKLNEELENRVEERTRELKESQELYKAIARNFPNGTIIVLNSELHYVFAEGKELSPLGNNSKDVLGKDFIMRIPEHYREEVKGKLNDVFKGKNSNVELVMEGKNYIINVVGLHNPLGEVSQVLVVLQNITPLKKAEQDMREALTKERTLNTLKSRFVSMASHEFRTPLTAVQSSVSLLSKYFQKDSKNKEKKEKHIRRIQSSVLNITNILNDFLSMDRLEEGRVMLRPVKFDLPEFTRGVTEDLKEMLKEGQVINYKHEGKDKVKLDKNLMKNIYNNLLSNAVKYSPVGTPIDLNTNYTDGHVVIKVEDKGIGISKADQEHLFERFFRAENAINIQGTGLGLNIVKKYVDMMNGNIEFESEPNKGSSFKVTIPIN